MSVGGHNSHTPRLAPLIFPRSLSEQEAPQSATLSILGLRSEMITRDPMWFNEAEHFKEATQVACAP
eukprot:6199008-Pleurochrysis_carterae.AAC.4